MLACTLLIREPVICGRIFVGNTIYWQHGHLSIHFSHIGREQKLAYPKPEKNINDVLLQLEPSKQTLIKEKFRQGNS